MGDGGADQGTQRQTHGTNVLVRFLGDGVVLVEAGKGLDQIVAMVGHKRRVVLLCRFLDHGGETQDLSLIHI